MLQGDPNEFWNLALNADNNDDGVITKAEFINSKQSDDSRNEAKQTFQKMDSNHDDLVTKPEFLVWFEKEVEQP